MTQSELDIERMVQAYQENAAFKAVIRFFLLRKRDPRNRVTQLENLRYDLSLRGEYFKLEDMQMVFKIFEEAGCGQYVKGRPIEKSRLNWSASARQVAETIMASLEESARGQKTRTNTSGAQDPGVEGDSDVEVFEFPVRPGVRLTIQIRVDMTATEIENLANFVRVIAASRAGQDQES